MQLSPFVAGAAARGAVSTKRQQPLLPPPLPPLLSSAAMSGPQVSSIVGTGGGDGGGGDDLLSLYQEVSTTAAAIRADAAGSAVVNVAEVSGRSDWMEPCSPGLVEFIERYLLGHGYVALFICVAGVLLNAVVIAVLTKRQMRNPVNTLLTLLACAELALAALYVPFDVIVYAAADHRLPLFVTSSYAAAAYILFYINAAVLLHMIGTWMIIATALFRYACVQFPVQSAVWCSQRRARLAAALVVGSCAVVCVPNMFRNAIIELPRSYFLPPQPAPPPPAAWPDYDAGGNLSAAAAAASASLVGGDGSGEPDDRMTYADDDILYTINSSAPFYHSEHLSRMNYWLYGLFGKVLPSVLLLVLTGMLISLLRVARRRRMRLYCPPQASSVAPPATQTTTAAAAAASVGGTTTASRRSGAAPPQSTTALPTIVLLLPPPSPRSGDGGCGSSDKEDESGERPLNGGGTSERRRISYDVAAAASCFAADPDTPSTAATEWRHGGGGDRRRAAGGGGGGGREHVRTTRMLLAVVVLFLAVDLPHGCLVIASAVDRCHLEAYNLLGDVIDLATLVAFSVNFALYCAMSKRFRELFADLLWKAVAAPALQRLAHLRCAVHALARAAGISSGGGRSDSRRAGVGAGASTASYRRRGRRRANGGELSERQPTSPRPEAELAAATSASIPNATRSSVRRGGGRARSEHCYASATRRAADTWSGKSSLDSFHLEVEQQHTSCSQLLCSSSSSGSDESLAQTPPSHPATEANRSGLVSR